MLNITTYYEQLFEKIKDIGIESCLNHDSIAKVHAFIEEIDKWKSILSNLSESDMIENVKKELQFSLLCNNIGLYRQSIASLRLCYEILFSFIYFSANKIDFQEWKLSKSDIKWSLIMSDENGVFSERFIKAFFPNYTEDISLFRENCRNSYRKMSEFIHGNYHTWNLLPEGLNFDAEMNQKWFSHFELLSEHIFLLLHYRFFNDYKVLHLQKIREINSENILRHIDGRV